jgi:hypothetical protein
MNCNPVSILSPDHLFDQADRLITPSPAGPPRQVDLRRAISAAYYGIFHAVLIAAADQYVGVTKRTTGQYTLVYRSVAHRWLRDLCDDVRKAKLPAKYTRYAPPSGFGANLKAFASAAVDLQEKRHSADYDPFIRVKSSDAILAVSTARAAKQRFESAEEVDRIAFLTLLLFPLRRE